MFRDRIPNNLVPQAPHLAIKAGAMGWGPEPPSPEQAAAMKSGLVEWLEAGAVGMAAGLEYQPGALSGVEELVDLCRVVASAGGVYAPHQRGYWSRLARGCGESFRIGSESGVKVHISHLAVDGTAAALLEEAQASGVDVTFDMYPYTAACTHLLMMLPEWAQAGGYAASIGQLTDSPEPERLRAETASRIAERGEIMVSCVEGVAVYHWPDSIDGEGIIRRTLAHPLYIGSTDGIYMGSRPHRRGFGTFARIAGEYVRGGALTLEQAVRKITGFPAERFSLGDRGLLAAGRAADITVFDPDSLADLSTWDNGRVSPSGIAHVIVNGEVVVDGGRPTGRLPGRIVGRS